MVCQWLLNGWLMVGYMGLNDGELMIKWVNIVVKLVPIFIEMTINGSKPVVINNGESWLNDGQWWLW